MVNNVQKVRKRFIIYILLIGIMVTSLAGVYFGVTYHFERKTNAEVLANIAMKNATSFYEQVSNKSQLLSSHATSLAAFDLADDNIIFDYMEDICNGTSFLKVGYSGPTGSFDFIDSDGVRYYDIDFSDNSLFIDAYNGNIYISDYISNDFAGENVTYYAAPVLQNGLVAGVICGINNNLIINEIFNAPLFNGHGYSFIISNDGKIVSNTSRLSPSFNIGDDFFDIFSINNKDKEMITKNHSLSKSTSLQIRLNGISTQVSITPVGINKWAHVGIIENKVLDSANRPEKIISILSFSLFIVAVALIFLLIDQSFKKYNLTIEDLAYRDSLTDLMNYSKFQIEATKLQGKALNVNLAVWSMDIRNFTQINELYGRRCGDKVLKRIATTLKEHQTSELELSCRVGSDHFAGITTYTTKDSLKKWYEKLMLALAATKESQLEKITIDYRIGFYCLSDFNENITIMQMVNNASFARRAYKRDNFESSLLSQKMREDHHLRATLENDAKEAMQNGEFTFFLQPKVDIHNGNIISGAEALCRWNHKALGTVSPGLFIPIFEDNGFIVDLDRYIFENVCKWISKNAKNNKIDICISVNVSLQGAMNEDFLDFYIATKKKYRIKNRTIELEFTESVLAKNYESFNATIATLQDEGFLCSIDDFGSGYSSLNLLKNIDIDVLKLDGLFFRETVDEKKGKTLIAGFLRIANDLNIKTVAEGVEEVKDVLFLQKTTCNQIQGYVFSKPMQKDDFVDYYLKNNGKGVISKQ